MAAAVVSAMAPRCPPSLHGPSRLSRASAGAVPPPPLLLSKERLVLQAQVLCSQLQAPPPFSLDDLHAPISGDDADVLARMFCEEEIQALFAAPRASLQSAGPRSDVQAGQKRKSPPSPSPSCTSDKDENEEASPPSPPVKIARTTRRSRRPASQRQIREWRKKIATRILRRRFRAPELSHGRTALGCRYLELALAGGGSPCALHQDAAPQPGHRAWMYSAQGRVPLVGPGEVLVPTLAAGNSKATVGQYARWRRGVRMPTRFYYAQAQAQRGVAAAEPQPDDSWAVCGIEAGPAGKLYGGRRMLWSTPRGI